MTTSNSAESRAVSRREVLRAAAAGLSGAAMVPSRLLGGAKGTPPSGTLNLAGIGIGGVGHHFLRALAEEETVRIAALCDVDDQYGAKSFDLWPQARRYRDFREMLDKERDLDGVLVATPDHSHAVIAMRAIKAGKHVLCVKPLTRTLWECRALTAAARKAGIATQVTATSRATNGALALCEMIEDGAIGDVREVHCWSDRPWWPQGMVRPAGEDPVPSHFDWDLWLGPAAPRPFKDLWPEDSLVLKQMSARARKMGRRGVYCPFNFRGWWDFGTGSLGDMACHHFNTVFAALKLGYPTSVEASSTTVLEESIPSASIVTWQFPAREGMPPMKLVWYDGGLRPPRPEEWDRDQPWPTQGNLFIGDKGKIVGQYNTGRIIPEKRQRAYKQPPKKYPRLPFREKNIVTAEWVAACRGGYTASCNFEVGGLLTEVALLGNIAIRTGKKLVWDAEKMRFTNDEEANQYVREPYRAGWTLD